MAISTAIPEQTTTDQNGRGIADVDISERKFSLNKRVLTAVTPRQAAMVAAIRALHAIAGVWPSGIGVARALRITRTAAYRRLKTLERIGIVLWAGGDVRIALQPDGVFLTMAEIRL